LLSDIFYIYYTCSCYQNDGRNADKEVKHIAPKCVCKCSVWLEGQKIYLSLVIDKYDEKGWYSKLPLVTLRQVAEEVR